jgi:hypothetical protein
MNAFQDVTPYLPLVVADFRQDDEGDHLSGAGWSLCVAGSWRLVAQDRMLAASDDERTDRSGRIDAVRGATVVRVEPQSPFGSIDVALVFADGRVFETFSDSVSGSWRLTVADVTYEGPMTGA